MDIKLIKLYQLEGEGLSWTSVSTLPKLKGDDLCSKKVYSGAIMAIFSLDSYPMVM